MPVCNGRWRTELPMRSPRRCSLHRLVQADQRINHVSDRSTVHCKMRRPNVTLSLLWDEYRTRATDVFEYSRSCNFYWAWVGRLKSTLRRRPRRFAGSKGASAMVHAARS